MVAARGTARAREALPLLALRPIAHLTKHGISHLYNDQTVRLADAVVGQFCYTVKRGTARRAGRVL